MTNDTDKGSQAEGLAEQASARTQDAVSIAQDKVGELREQGSVQLRDQFDRRSAEAGAQVRSVAQALRRASNDVRSEGNANAARLTGKTSDRIERFGVYLEQKSAGELMGDLETFARRRPWMLAGIGMLVGVAAARFMKASSEQRYDGHLRTNGQWPSRVGTKRAARYGQAGAGDDELFEESASGPGSRQDPHAREAYVGAR